MDDAKVDQLIAEKTGLQPTGTECAPTLLGIMMNALPAIVLPGLRFDRD